MKAKFIILFNSNRDRCHFKYKVIPIDYENLKLKSTNGFNEKIVGIYTISYSRYLEQKEMVKNRLKH